MKMTIIGGGNVGTLMAAEFSSKGHEITIFTSKPHLWNKELTVLDDCKNVLMSGNVSKITNDMQESVNGAEIIWITYPAELFDELGEQISKYIKAGQIIGVVPGSGGAEFAFKKSIDKGAILFGLQRVHSIARIQKYGESVYMLGRKNKLELGTIPTSKSKEISILVESLFNIPCDYLPNYLCVTLTPSNPILHTTRLYAMFKDYNSGVYYSHNFLFYEEWDNFSSEILIACDEELQMLCSRIPMDLNSVVSLKKYYENDTAEGLTIKISGIKAFKGITSPMVERDRGWIPDFKSRYFSTDFPYGLKIIKDIAILFEVNTPNIDKVWSWYCELNKENQQKFNLNITKNEFLDIYR